jgi:DNA modification methylase
MSQKQEIKQIKITTPDGREARIAELRRLFPDLFDGEGVLDEKALRQLVTEEAGHVTERFRFEWAGKAQSKRFAFSPSKATLVYDPERSVNADGAVSKSGEVLADNTSKNLVIEGDNLEVLKILQTSYFEKVKCIYIDPPYNTGKDFIYPDNYSQTRKDYWESDGTTKKGVRLKAVTESSGRRHSEWLNFMHSRLLLARNFLRPDGVVLISIDENEQHNLRKLCDEVFGETNYAGEIIWKNSSKNDQNYVSIQHEYILAYVKDKSCNPGVWTERKEGLEEIYKAFSKFRKKHGTDWDEIHKEALAFYNSFNEANPIYSSKHYSWMDERGVYFPDNISGPNFGQYRYDVTHPVTKEIVKEPGSGWRFPEETMNEKISHGLIHFGKNETTIPKNKTYLKNTENQTLSSVKYRDGRVASNALKALMGEDIFTNPKDVEILSSLFTSLGVEKEDLVLDFFAGSGATAHAVQNMNVADGGLRNFICVQIPEWTDEKSNAYSAGYKTISAITIERIKRSGANIYGGEEESVRDIGFRVFSLKKSHFSQNTFNPSPEKIENENIKALEEHLQAAAQLHLFEDDELYGIVTEIALKNGFGLFYRLEPLDAFTKNSVHRLDGNDKSAIICLDGQLNDETIEALKAHSDDQLIVLKAALDTTKKFGLQTAFQDNLWVV